MNLLETTKNITKSSSLETLINNSEENNQNNQNNNMLLLKNQLKIQQNHSNQMEKRFLSLLKEKDLKLLEIVF